MKIFLRFLIGVCSLVSISSCKKTIDKAKEDYVLGVLTDGR